jgi:hypothetical protein
MGFLKTPRFSYGDSKNIWVVFNVYVMEYEADAAYCKNCLFHYLE